jgi:hypothetical protein
MACSGSALLYLHNIHCKFGGGTVNMLRATKSFFVYGANVHIVEFLLYITSAIYCSMLEEIHTVQ